jgi:P27 family predicted phage terminase small subunit
VSASGKKLWRSVGKVLDTARVITKADGIALELLVDAYVEYRTAREVVEREGTTFESFIEVGEGDAATVARAMIRTHPEVMIARDAWRRVKSMLSEFGMTPATRAKISTTDSAGEGDPFDSFMEDEGDSRKRA